MHGSIQATYKPGSQPLSEILMKDLAIWLSKYAGVTYTCAACLEEYATCMLTKMAHSNASWLRKWLLETAKSKDILHCQKRWLATSTRLNVELSVLAPTNQPSMTVGFLHFIKVLTNHNRTWTRYIGYQRCSKMTGVMFYDKEYSCLSKTMVTHRHVTIIILIVHT